MAISAFSCSISVIVIASLNNHQGSSRAAYPDEVPVHTISFEPCSILFHLWSRPFFCGAAGSSPLLTGSASAFSLSPLAQTTVSGLQEYRVLCAAGHNKERGMAVPACIRSSPEDPTCFVLERFFLQGSRVIRLDITILAAEMDIPK